ncbi:MAG: adenylate/guanylate cyclase domain-containing protein [Rhizobiaceae bacterium]
MVIVTMMISIGALFFIASSVYQNSYGEIERSGADKDLQRLESVFVDELSQMFALLEDYASWDDTYAFAQSRSQDYIDSNLSGDTFSNLGVQVLMMLDRNGQLLHASSYDLDQDNSSNAVQHLLSLLGPEGELFELNPREFGLLRVNDQVMLIAMAPILQSNDSGPPRGIALLGRFLDAPKLKQLSIKTQLQISSNLYSDSADDAGGGEAADLSSVIAEFDQQGFADRDSLGKSPHVQRILSEDTLMGYVLMPDLFGEPLLLWKVEIPRDIHQQGERSLNFLLISMSLVGLVLVACIVLLLELLVLRRVGRLSGEVSRIGENDDLSERVTSLGQDELGFLARSVNAMLGNIQLSKERLEVEHERAENLLLNILPASIATRLKDSGDQIANSHEEVSVLFADLVGFTELSARMKPDDLVSMLNDVFSEFDDLADEIGLEKIKTIGDAYMVAAGLPEFRHDHADAIAEMAMQMVEVIDSYANRTGLKLNIRVGINTGQVVAGVIGKKKFIYDLWGDTVNIASRMESSGEAGMIQVSRASHVLLKHAFAFQSRGEINIKGRGRMETFQLLNRLEPGE